MMGEDVVARPVLSDAEIVGRIRSAEARERTEGERYLVERHGARLIAYLVRRFGLSGDDAEELAAETIEHALEVLDELREPAKLAAWLRMSAHRRAISAYRRATRPPPKPAAPPAALLGIAEAPEDLDDAELRAWRRVVARQVSKASENLPLRYRDVWEALLNGLSIQEIAEMNHITPNNASQLRFRTLGRMRKELKELGVDLIDIPARGRA